MQDNLKKKYDITDGELKRVVDQLDFGKLCGDSTVIIALCDLIANGDIPPEKE